MADVPASTYCPKCRAVQRTFHFTEASRTIHRCQVCGFAVERGLVLEAAEALGLPNPSEIKILCVDDDPATLELHTEILRSHGFTVLTASDGPTALEAAVREVPALILLDIRMPGMDGFQVCRRLKTGPATEAIPVIILTAATDPELTVLAFEAGAELALQKPAEPSIILRTIEAALALAASRTSGEASEPGMEPMPPEAAAAEPEAIPDLAVPTRSVPVTLWIADGATLRAQIFLRFGVETRAGPERVEDRLNGPDLFLTLSEADETPLLFLNKDQVIRVEAPEEEWPPDPAGLPGGMSIETVRVRLVNGEQFIGTVRIEGPAGKRRLSDFLNTPAAFLPLAGTDRLHLLHKRFIARVAPEQPSAGPDRQEGPSRGQA